MRPQLKKSPLFFSLSFSLLALFIVAFLPIWDVSSIGSGDGSHITHKSRLWILVEQAAGNLRHGMSVWECVSFYYRDDLVKLFAASAVGALVGRLVYWRSWG